MDGKHRSERRLIMTNQHNDVSPDNTYALLNKRLQEIANIIGLDNTLIMVANFRGRGVDITKKANPSHRIAKLIGLEAFKKLCAYYGGTRLEIDMNHNLLRHQKRLAIKKGKQEGKTNGELAVQFNCTERYIRRTMQRLSETNNDN